MVSISQERAMLAKVPGVRALRRREQWGARFNYTTARAVTEPATRVFVHITITEPSRYSSNDAHARAVESIGINRFPATGISYNRLIMPDGSAYEGQPMGRRGAHTVNDFKRSTCSTSGCPGRGSSLSAPSYNLNYNARSYVICQNTQHPVSDKQLDAVARAIAADKLAGLVTRAAAIHGHRCVSAKSCPGDRMWVRMGELNKLVDRYVTNGLGPEPQEDDMPYRDWPKADKDALLADVFRAVWSEDHGGIPAPQGYDATENPTWAASSVIRSAQYFARRAAELAGAPTDVAALAAALAPLLPSGNAPTQEQLEAALRNVLGSLDDPA